MQTVITVLIKNNVLAKRWLNRGYNGSNVYPAFSQRPRSSPLLTSMIIKETSITSDIQLHGIATLRLLISPVDIKFIRLLLIPTNVTHMRRP